MQELFSTSKNIMSFDDKVGVLNHKVNLNFECLYSLRYNIWSCYQAIAEVIFYKEYTIDYVVDMFDYVGNIQF